MRKISNFQKNGIYVKELCQVYIEYKLSSIYLEQWPNFGVLKVENGHFSRYTRRFVFSDFQKLSDLGRSKVF